eukprot:381172-Pelagomonas_calceolata.AAC.1
MAHKWCCALDRVGLPHGNTPRAAKNHATKGHATPQHVPNQVVSLLVLLHNPGLAVTHRDCQGPDQLAPG